MKTNSLPLVPYLRQSRAKERTISIDAQRRDVQQWAEGAGVKLAQEIVEQNVSGSKPRRERGIGDAVAACERGEASGIIVAWQDRLSRENGLATAEVWEALEAADARLVSVGDSMDTASGDHEMLFTIRAAIARDQWKRHRANWEKAQPNAAERGVACSRANIGYRKANRGEPFTINESEAAKVRQAFELRAAGVAISRIYKLDGLDVEHVSPARLVYEHTAEHRLSLAACLEELENLLDLVADDGIEDHRATIRRNHRRVFDHFEQPT
jgi:DNA invertase Pin-like site-specific DNA recombinase